MKDAKALDSRDVWLGCVQPVATMLHSLTDSTDILCPGAFETQRLSKVKSKRASYLITQGNAAATFHSVWPLLLASINRAGQWLRTTFLQSFKVFCFSFFSVGQWKHPLVLRNSWFVSILFCKECLWAKCAIWFQIKNCLEHLEEIRLLSPADVLLSSFLLWSVQATFSPFSFLCNILKGQNHVIPSALLHSCATAVFPAFVSFLNAAASTLQRSHGFWVLFVYSPAGACPAYDVSRHSMWAWRCTCRWSLWTFCAAFVFMSAANTFTYLTTDWYTY